MKRIILLILVLALSAFTACDTPQSDDLMQNITHNSDMTKSAELSDVSNAAVTDFAVRLFKESVKDDNNTLISPLSVLMALSMTENGADNETLSQMESVDRPFVYMLIDCRINIPFFIGTVMDFDCEKASVRTSAKKSEFLKKAEAIETYSKNNYETALTQNVLNTESYNVFMQWEALLNEVYQYLKASMHSDDFADIESGENQWKSDMEKAVEEEAEKWKNGSGEAMVRNAVGSKYIKERCYYLISQIK